MTDHRDPEKIVHVYDPTVVMKGVVPTDCTALGLAAGGGILMLPDITTREIFQLPRVMTYKSPPPRCPDRWRQIRVKIRFPNHPAVPV